MTDFDDGDDTLSPELMAMMEGGGATAIMASGGGGGKSSGGGGGGGGGSYASLSGTLEKKGTSKKDKPKKRHFVLGQNSLTYAASSKPDAKVLGIINLSGSTCKQQGESIIINADGKDVEMAAKSATEAQKWSDAIKKNIKLASDDE